MGRKGVGPVYCLMSVLKTLDTIGNCQRLLVNETNTIPKLSDASEVSLSSISFFECFRYEQQVREQQSQLEKEDFSDMVAEHAAKQKVSW